MHERLSVLPDCFHPRVFVRSGGGLAAVPVGRDKETGELIYEGRIFPRRGAAHCSPPPEHPEWHCGLRLVAPAGPENPAKMRGLCPALDGKVIEVTLSQETWERLTEEAAALGLKEITFD